jgi:hypothetical protein
MSFILFKAINGPLQQRTSILDLDDSRANTFPQDYDTDIESEWSNLSKMIFLYLKIINIESIFLKIYLLMEMIFLGKKFNKVEIFIIKNK